MITKPRSTPFGTIPQRSAVLILVVWVGLVTLATPGEVEAQGAAAGYQAVPAEFLRYITMPGQGEQIRRPSALHYDRFHDEVLIGDPGHNRIVVFTASGAYKFEFSLNETMTSPRDIATDSQGYIYVAGSDPRGSQVQVFDFDGTPLRNLALPLAADGRPVIIHSLAIGPDDQFFGLAEREATIYVFDRTGAFRRTIPVVLGDDAEPDDFREIVLGTLAISGDELLIPISSVGTVIKLATDGRYLGSIGRFGAKAGTLNFPVAVERSPDGLYLVLDTARFCVVCYDGTGRALGEFGGKGINPGWFINPTLLAVASAEHVLIGQIFHSKIQACSVPEFIRLGQARISADAVAEPAALTNRASGGTERRSSPDRSLDLIPRGEEFPSSHIQDVSHLEVTK